MARGRANRRPRRGAVPQESSRSASSRPLNVRVSGIQLLGDPNASLDHAPRSVYRRRPLENALVFDFSSWNDDQWYVAAQDVLKRMSEYHGIYGHKYNCGRKIMQIGFRPNATAIYKMIDNGVTYGERNVPIERVFSTRDNIVEMRVTNYLLPSHSQTVKDVAEAAKKFGDFLDIQFTVDAVSRIPLTSIAVIFDKASLTDNERPNSIDIGDTQADLYWSDVTVGYMYCHADI